MGGVVGKIGVGGSGYLVKEVGWFRDGGELF
jgi:hypothetical protein